MNKILEALRNDLQKNGAQSSWDFYADERFAIIIGDSVSAELIRNAIDSGSLMIARTLAVESTGITKKRLRALRKLVKLGIVKARWSGLGEGGRREFGVGRIRDYYIYPPPRSRC